MKNFRILYIYGWNSSPQSETFKTLQELLPQHNLISIPYDQTNPPEAINFFNNYYIPNSKINLVVGSSFGGFIASHIKHSIFKILINPCLQPSTEIPKLNKIPNNLLEEYKRLESLKKADDEETHFTHAFFSTHDELFSHKELYLALGYHHFTDLPNEKHRLTKTGLEEVANRIKVHPDQAYFVGTNKASAQAHQGNDSPSRRVAMSLLAS